ncbi:MAG: hypothetical protein JWL77_903 [Chthonomonadaceae bacterium]|nr:hypothetical protein [Chthonomonadaceae bacterium]
MQDPGSQNPNGAPNNPYGGYNPYSGMPPNAKQQAFGSTVTQDERNMGMLAHLLQIFTGFLGPLVIYLIKKDQSKFVAYHALQALVWQIGYGATIMLGVFLTFALTIVTNPHGPSGFPIFFIFFWLLAMGGGVLNLGLGILYTIKASNGEWSSYPVIGNWVRRFL